MKDINNWYKVIGALLVLSIVFTIITSSLVSVTGLTLLGTRGGVASSSGSGATGDASGNPSGSSGTAATTAKSSGSSGTAATTAKPSGSSGTAATTAAPSGGGTPANNDTPTNATPAGNDTPTTPAANNSAEYAQLLADYTAVVNKVKVDKPGYKNNDWQTMTNKDMKIYGLVNPIAGNFLETKEDSSEGTHEKGSYPKWFAMPTSEVAPVGCVLTDTSKIESASSVTNADGTKTITITLIPEKDPVKDFDDPASVSSWHGQMFDVIDITQVVEYAKKIPGVNADNAYCMFHGTATLTYNPANNQCVSLDHVIDVAIFLSGQANVVADYHFYDFEW